MKFVPLAFTVVLGLSLFAERQPFERYQPIIDRQMFGRPPIGFDPTKPPSEVSRSEVKSETELQAQERIKTAIRFSAINVTPEGDTAVGFTDSSDAKNPVHYYLKVGESRNGWLVKEADPVKATMTIVKDEVEVTLSIGGNSAQSGALGKDASTSARTAGTGHNIFAGRSSPLSLPPGMQSSSRGLRTIREQKRREREEAAAEKQREKAEQLEKMRQEAWQEGWQQGLREDDALAQRAAKLEDKFDQVQEVLRKVRENHAARDVTAPAADENGGNDAEQQ